MSQHEFLDNCPQDVQESLRLYVDHHIPPGDFLLAVLSNDLTESFARADLGNRMAMFWIVGYCYNHLPSGCWGSRAKVKEWLSHKETSQP